MKSKRKVFEHLGEVAYTKNAANRIMGFLLGCGIVEKGEVVEFKNPDIDEPRCNFDGFYAWFENEEEELAVLGSLIEDLSDAQQEALWLAADRTWRKFRFRSPSPLLCLLHQLTLDFGLRGTV